MEQKENQRIMLTKRLLQNALLKLLKTVPLHAISIRELCKEAGINRTTFYNHYGSQYDLLSDISQRFLDSIAERLESADASDRESVHQRVAMVLEYIAQNRELSILLINNNIDPSFVERIFSLPQIGDLLEAALVNCQDDQRRAATISFVIHGSYKLLQDWINQENRLPPVQQTELILELAQRVCV
ncbi:MAG: TetR/AcrR family transcriptional regulator [Clostridia bacterium]|nr:TetR/AcrR family transcriptional regulator [Clostridia bacterium]